MKLYTRCSNCGEFIYFKIRIEDRFQLAKRKGEKIQLKCEECQISGNYHVNEIVAEKRNLISMMAIVIFVIGTIILMFFILNLIGKLANIYAISGLISLMIIPFLIYRGINISEEEKVRYFNRKIYG